LDTLGSPADIAKYTIKNYSTPDLPRKGTSLKGMHIFQPSIFRGYASFQVDVDKTNGNFEVQLLHSPSCSPVK